jgi:hypothetical protein
VTLVLDSAGNTRPLAAGPVGNASDVLPKKMYLSSAGGTSASTTPVNDESASSANPRDAVSSGLDTHAIPERGSTTAIVPFTRLVPELLVERAILM